jgi:VWFA-related protein
VIAKDKHGNPVSGLEAKDFTLMDDGAPQKISRVTVEHGKEENTSQQIGVPDAPARPVQPVFSNAHPDNVVPTVILFDVLNTSIEDQASMRKGLLQSLNRLKDGTPIALLILGDDLTVVSDFTTSSISLTKVAETGFHPRMEGFGPALTSRKTRLTR